MRVLVLVAPWFREPQKKGELLLLLLLLLLLSAVANIEPQLTSTSQSQAAVRNSGSHAREQQRGGTEGMRWQSIGLLSELTDHVRALAPTTGTCTGTRSSMSWRHHTHTQRFFPGRTFAQHLTNTIPQFPATRQSWTSSRGGGGGLVVVVVVVVVLLLLLLLLASQRPPVMTTGSFSLFVLCSI